MRILQFLSRRSAARPSGATLTRSSPGDACANVVASEMGTVTAPVTSSGSCTSHAWPFKILGSESQCGRRSRDLVAYLAHVDQAGGKRCICEVAGLVCAGRGRGSVSSAGHWDGSCDCDITHSPVTRCAASHSRERRTQGPRWTWGYVQQAGLGACFVVAPDSKRYGFPPPCPQPILLRRKAKQHTG